MLTGLPTDNLYKFVTVGAMALIGLFFWFGDQAFTGRLEREKELSTAIERSLESGKKVTQLKNRLNAISGDRQNYLERFELENAINDVRKEEVELRRVQEIYEDYQTVFFIQFFSSAFGGILSMIVAAFGGVRWYGHQKLNDRLLELQVKKAEIDLKENEANTTGDQTAITGTIHRRQGSPVIRLRGFPAARRS